MEDSRIEQKSSQGQTTQLPRMRLWKQRWDQDCVLLSSPANILLRPVSICFQIEAVFKLIFFRILLAAIWLYFIHIWQLIYYVLSFYIFQWVYPFLSLCSYLASYFVPHSYQSEFWYAIKFDFWLRHSSNFQLQFCHHCAIFLNYSAINLSYY